jgi:hypothetical protein
LSISPIATPAKLPVGVAIEISLNDGLDGAAVRLKEASAVVANTARQYLIRSELML